MKIKRIMKLRKMFVASTYALIFFAFFFVPDSYSGEIRGVTEDTIKLGEISIFRVNGERLH